MAVSKTVPPVERGDGEGREETGKIFFHFFPQPLLEFTDTTHWIQQTGNWVF
jgi:hypothetical protein